MPNPWLRLWTDMPHDPKWRTIARASGQTIALVQAVYLQLLVSASNAEKRGVTQCNAEDIASSLDVTQDAVTAILQSMQGRVMDGQVLTGWDRRQPKREDSSANRVAEHRKRNVTQSNAEKRPEEIRGEENREEVRASRGKRESISEPSEADLIGTGITLDDYRSHQAVRKLKKSPFTSVDSRDRWIAQWRGFYAEGKDTAAMIGDMITKNWVGEVSERWKQRKREYRDAQPGEDFWSAGRAN